MATLQTWNDPNNASNPRNWQRVHRWSIIVIVSYIEFLTHLTSLMYAPSLPQVQQEFHDERGVLTPLSMTIYVLGFAIGPILLAPLSELYGRLRIYRTCTVVYLGLTIACALSTTLYMLIAFRFFAGCFGAAPVAIGGAIVSDLFPQERRGNAMAIYGVGPVLGPLLGPIIGGYVAQAKGWRWIFWVATILAGIATVCSFVFLRETHHPTIMRTIRSSLPLEERPPELENTLKGSKKIKANLKAIFLAIRRPLWILAHSPAILLCCSLLALVSGINNLVNATLGLIYQNQYKFSVGESGLVYIGMALGSVGATFVAARTSDRILKHLARNNDDEMRPEYRLPTIAIGAPLMAAGLIFYGWTAEYKLFWFVPIIGLTILGMGITTLSLSMRTYLVDAYTTYAASVLAASTMTRSIGGSLIPLAGPALNQNLGLGWGNSLLALLILGLCPVALILYIWGPKLREMYPLANT